VVREAGVAPRDLDWLADLLRCLENEPLQSERLRRMEAESHCEGLSASESIQRLGKLHGWLASGDNLVFAAFCKFFLWETQFAFAIEAWRARFGPKVELWLRRLAEFEALSSLAGYAYEHPADSFPELLSATEPARAPIALAVGLVALRNPELLLNVLQPRPDREGVLLLLQDAFDMLSSEDYELERFYVDVRHAYWAAAPNSPRPCARSLLRPAGSSTRLGSDAPSTLPFRTGRPEAGATNRFRVNAEPVLQ
jgi:hypothetical protein